jgi:nitrogen fixation/metabolism regulation signal transduction histidine kinase
MLAVLIVSLLVIGISTTLFFIEENEEYHRERVTRKASTIIEAIQYFTKEVPLDESLDVVIKGFDDKIQELADINNIDINIYTTKGEIIVSSYLERDEHFYKNSVPSEIFEQLKKETTVLIPAEVDGEKTIGFYSYAYNINHEKVGIIHLPYSETNEFLEKEIEVFFSTLVKIYVVLLLIGGLIAYFLSNYITRSLRVISDRFKNVQFNIKNEKLEWKSRDEIGLLVHEYNKMIDQLEQSADKLARTERETAWREMAKQVAHEIKNPLTPMKLSIQHLERTYTPNDPDFKARLERFSKNLIEQIDTLSNIASEFSNFAKMPKAKFEAINLLDVITSSADLFKSEINIRCLHDNDQALIQGDKEQLLRVFSNLIKNSIQAIPKDQKGEITITTFTDKHTIKVAVIDNGSGISEAQKELIFVPNFTTKTTGTGLGLAMVKNIIEQHEGSIWFESEPDKGTTFYIQLPLK